MPKIIHSVAYCSLSDPSGCGDKKSGSACHMARAHRRVDGIVNEFSGAIEAVAAGDLEAQSDGTHHGSKIYCAHDGDVPEEGWLCWQHLLHHTSLCKEWIPIHNITPIDTFTSVRFTPPSDENSHLNWHRPQMDGQMRRD